MYLLSEGYCCVGDLMESNMILEDETKYDVNKVTLSVEVTFVHL